MTTSRAPHWSARALATSLVGGLALTLGGTGALAPAAAEPGAPAEPAEEGGGQFASSFETDDPQPAVSTPFEEDPTNFTGGMFGPHSLLGLVTAVTASGENEPNEVAANAADGNPNSKWLVFTSTGTLTYELSEAAAITGYSITSANDAPDRDPRDFTVQGSTDGETWTDLDTRTGQSWATEDSSNRLVTTTYELTDRSANYTYYRLQVTANNGAGILQLADWDLLDSQRDAPPSPMVTEVADGPTSSSTAKTGVGFTGVQSLRYAGHVLADGDATATNELFDVDLQVAEDSELHYTIFPVLDPDLTYGATYAAVDLVFADGTRLSATDAQDAYGFGIAARSQGQADILWPGQWNSVTVDLAAFAGRTVESIVFTYDQPDAPAGTPISGYLDDISIAPATTLDTSEGLVSYVDTRRGTNSSGGFSRGNTFPAVAVPNGFNFITPMTDANTTGTLYAYQRSNNAQNLPTLQAIGFSHEPSIWMGDRNQLAVLPAAGTEPTSSLAGRELAFRHENETARPDLYSVTFENGISTAVTPTDHAAVYRFTFADESGSVLVDQGVGDSGLQVSADGTVTGWVDGGSGWPGRTRMFVYGQFDATPTANGPAPAGDRDSARYAAFDTSADNTIELRIASSFISTDQAEKNFDLEVAGRSFEEVHQAAQQMWNERLGVITDVEGATENQLVTLYSSLYRLNLYPNSQFENTGTAENPVYKYASPVSPTVSEPSATHTGAKIVEGKIYVNNGFWDTYRTAWPLYALLYPEVTEELVDGFVQQYRDGGWVARWSSPGYADLMTGTSSDVAFAEAYLAGALDTETALDAYDAAVKNATVLPPSNNVGRKGLDQSIFLGFTPATTHQSASWGLEGYINDYGIAQMAAALAEDPNTPPERVDQLRQEAEYFQARAHEYVNMFNPEAGTFTARNADGSWPVGADFDKKDWGGAFTEASAWTFAFHAPHDVDGLAALYGGRQGLVDELHEFLSTPEQAAYSGIHEAREARDVRLGMLGMSNQVAHHIPYVLAEAGDPSGAQELIREITQRLFAGSDIGQGYPGDEDNGEFSSWFIFSALGFYPLHVGSGDYTIGSPLFDSITLNIGDNPLIINAPGAGSQDKVYVAGVDINGKEITETTFDGDLVRAGGTLTFTMSSEPSDWGAKDLGEDLSVPEAPVDATDPEYGELRAAEDVEVSALNDDNMRSAATFDQGTATLTWTSTSGPVSVDRYTLTSTEDSDSADPAQWTLAASTDGKTWTELDSREGQTFRWGTQTRPFSVPGDEVGGYTSYRLTVATEDGSALGLAEIELFATATEGGDLTVSAAADARVRVGEEFTGPLATISDGAGTPESVQVDYGDGSEVQQAELEQNDLGGWTAYAPHTFDRPGVYSAVVTVTGAGGTHATATTQVSVFRDETLAGGFNNVCLGDLGQTAANCDGQGHGYFRDKLADSGFVQGEELTVPGTELTYRLPQVEPGEPDNVITEGQTLSIDLGEGATQLSFIGTATETDKQRQATLTYADGTTQEVPLEFGDWVGAAGDPQFGNVVVGTSQGRLSGTDAESPVKNAAIFATAPVNLATGDDGEVLTATTLTLPQGEGSLSGEGRIHLFAIASDGDRSGQELQVTAGEVPGQTTGEEFTAELATVTGGAAAAEQSAVINWGDASSVSTVPVSEGAVTGTHTYTRPGTYPVSVTVDDGLVSRTVQVQIEVTDPESAYDPRIKAAPGKVRPGKSVNVIGHGFAPGETVTLTFDGDVVREVTVKRGGNFAAKIAVPSDAADGRYPITAIGEISQQRVSTEIHVQALPSGPQETAVELRADIDSPVAQERFELIATVAPSAASGTVEFRQGEEVLATAAVSDGRGVADVALTTSGEHVLRAYFIPDDSSLFTGSSSAELVLDVGSAPVLDPVLTLSASSVAPGQDVKITGSGFAESEAVRLELHSDPVTLRLLEADADGGFTSTVTLPVDAEPGEHHILATGTESGATATVALSIARPQSAGPGVDGGKTASDATGEGSGGATDGDRSSGGDMPATGFSGLGMLLGATVLIVLGAASLVGIRRRGH